MKISASKRLRLLSSSSGSAGVDRLGDLPDEILLRIFSSIPVKEAVRTSALSRRWRHLQTLIPVINNLRLDPVSMNCKLPYPNYEVHWKQEKKWVEAVDQHLEDVELVEATKLKGFLAAATELSCLTFRSNSVWCLSQGEPEGFPISFQTLKVLSVSMELKHRRKALLVVELLENCPQLQQLTLSITGGYGVKPKQFSKYREKLQRLPCFPHHLEEVKLSRFTARTYQMKLARLILREAKVLKKMTLKLRSSYSEELPTAVKDLLAMKNASTQVIVMTHMDHPIQFL